MPLGREKQFGELSGEEKEVLNLAAEILLWSNAQEIITWPGALKLREDATALYEMAQNMDMEHDDKYYRVYEAMDKLRREYDELKKEVKKWFDLGGVWVDMEGKKSDELVGIIQKLLDQYAGEKVINVRLKQEFPVKPKEGWHTGPDLFFFNITRTALTDDKTGEPLVWLEINELFTEWEYKAPLVESAVKVVESFFGKTMEEIIQQYGGGTRYGHAHGGNDLQYVLRLPYLPRSAADKVIGLVLKTIEENPRQRRVQS